MKHQKSKPTVPVHTITGHGITKVEIEQDIMTDRMSMPDNMPSIERLDSLPKRSQINLADQKRDTHLSGPANYDSPSQYSSQMSEKKQSEHYDKEWKSPSERAKFMSRFKSFEITETSLNRAKNDSVMKTSTLSKKMLKFPSISSLKMADKQNQEQNKQQIASNFSIISKQKRPSISLVKKLQNTNDLSALLGLGEKNKSGKPGSKDIFDNEAFVLNNNKDFIQQNIQRLALASDRSQGLLPPIIDESPREMATRRQTIQPIGPPVETMRYETQNEQNLRLGQQRVKHAQNFLGYNPYDLSNYRAENKKLPFSLPGERFQLNKKLDPNVLVTIEDRKLQNYLEMLNDDKQALKQALRASYQKALEREKKEHNKLQQQVLRTSLPNTTKTSESKALVGQEDLSRSDQEHAFSSPFIQAEKHMSMVLYDPNQVEDQVRLQVAHYLQPSYSGLTQASFLPPEVQNYLEKKHRIDQRPRRLQSITQRSVPVGYPERPVKDNMISQQKLRHHSLFSQCQQVIKQTNKLSNMSDNITLKNLSQQMRDNINKTVSVTGFISSDRNVDILQNYRTFVEKSRINHFEVEDFYLQRNQLPLESKQGLSGAQFNRNLMKLNLSSKLISKKSQSGVLSADTSQQDVIHVTIDRQSLKQLTSLPDSEITQNQSLKQITHSSHGQIAIRQQDEYQSVQKFDESSVSTETAQNYALQNQSKENIMSTSTRNFINIDASTGTLLIHTNQAHDGRLKTDLISIIEGNNQSGHDSSKTLVIEDSNKESSQVEAPSSSAHMREKKKREVQSRNGSQIQQPKVTKPSPFQHVNSPQIDDKKGGSSFEGTVRSLQIGHETLHDTDGTIQDWEGVNSHIKTTWLNQGPPDGRQFSNLMTDAEKQQRMLELTFGRLTPGEAFDLSLEQQVKALNQKYMKVNFGIEINNDTFDFFLPRRLDKEKHKVLYRQWKQRQIIFKHDQLEQRIKNFNEGIVKFKQERRHKEDFRQQAKDGYDKQIALQQMQINNMRSNVILLGASPSKDRFVSQEVELKVRKLLGRTELKEIASTAKVYVEICDQPKINNQVMIENSSGSTITEPTRVPVYHNVSSMMASKIKLEERPNQLTRLKMSPNDASKMSNIYSTNSSNVSSLYKVVPAPKHLK